MHWPGGYASVGWLSSLCFGRPEGLESREWLQKSVADFAERATRNQPYTDLSFLCEGLSVMIWSIMFHTAMLCVFLYFTLFQIMILYRNNDVGEGEDVVQLSITVLLMLVVALYCWMGKFRSDIWCDKQQVWKGILALLCFCGVCMVWPYLRAQSTSVAGIDTGWIIGGGFCMIMIMFFLVHNPERE